MDEQSIFLQALEKPAGETRKKWLDEACRGDAALRARIDALLRRDAQAGNFLEGPPTGLEATLLPTGVGESLASALEGRRSPAFPHDEAAAIDNAGRSVLNYLGNTIDVPRVVLRDSKVDCGEPITRPRSPEMPKFNPDSRYQLQGEIARGGMGAILRGRDNDLGRDLAIKVLLDEHKARPEVIQRFIEEAQIGGQLQHPGIAPIYELGQFADRRPFFSMKLVKGETLSKLLAERQEPAEDRARFLSIFEHVCQTMAYAHSRGVIHRDLKPANIMIGAFGEVQVMDWGLAKVLPAGGVADEKKAYDQQQGRSMIQTLRSKVGSDGPIQFGSTGSQTQMGSVMGTPAYMPPEQALGEIDNLDERADVFGLGAILCEVLTGKPPYVGEHGTQVFRMASRGKLAECFERLDACGADAELIAITKQCLAVEPKDRPRDAGVLAQRVTGYLESVETKLHQTEVERAAEAARVVELHRRRKLLYAIASLLLTGLIAAGVAANHFYNLETTQRQLAQKNIKLAEEREQERNAAIEARESAKQQRDRAEQQTLIAEENRRIAEQQRDVNRRNLYVAQIQLAHQARSLVQGTARMSALLDSWLPEAGTTDPRGWEWFYLQSLKNTEEFAITTHPHRVRACEWSPDGRFIATGDENAQVVIRHASNGHVHKVLAGHVGHVTSLSWHPQGTRLVSASQDRTMRVWDVEQGVGVAELTGLEAPVNAVAWSHDGTKIASGSDKKVALWDAETKKVLESIDVACQLIAWTANDAGIVIQQGKETLLWDASAKSEPRSFLTDNNNFRPVMAMSRDGQFVATADQSDIRLRDLRTGVVLKSLRGHKLPPLSMDFSPDGQKLASAGGEGWITIWDLQSNKDENVLYGQEGDVLAVRWHPDGQRIASAAKDVRIWNATRIYGELEVQTSNERTFNVVWSPDGRRVATSGQSGRIEIRDTDSGRLLNSMPAGQGWSEGLAWHPYHPWLATCSRDDCLRIWNTESGDMLREITTIKRMRSIAWRPDGRQLACCGQTPDSEVILLDADSWDVVGKLNLSNAIVMSVKWSPDGTKIAAVGEEHIVRVWDATNGALITSFPGATCLAWSHAGDRLATTAGPITIWDTTEWRQVASLHGHTSLVYSLDWSADDTRLLSSSHDSTAVLWDVESSSQLMTLRQGRDQVHAAIWDPDSLRIATVDSRGYLHLLDARRAAEREDFRPAVLTLDRRLQSNPNDLDALRLRWKWNLRHGQLQNAEKEKSRLIEQYQARLAETLDERVASDLVDVLLANGKPLPERHVVQLVQLESATGTSLIAQDDGSILAGPKTKTPNFDSYHIRCRSPLRRIGEVWLEAIPHSSLPGSTSGWGGGNFHLTEVRAEVHRVGGKSIPITFAFAASDRVRPVESDSTMDDGPWATIDGTHATHWDIWPDTRSPHTLVLKLAQPLDLAEGDEISIHLDFLDPKWSDARLGCFRISVSECDTDFSLIELSWLASRNSLGAADRLAAAYLILGKADEALKLLSHKNASVDSLDRQVLLALVQRLVGQSDAARQIVAKMTNTLQTQQIKRELQGIVFQLLHQLGGYDRLQYTRLLHEPTIQRELARLTQAIAASPDNAAVYQSRASYYASLGRWRASAADYAKSVEIEPVNRVSWSFTAPLLVLAEDIEGIKQHAQAMRKQFAGSDQPEVVDAVCKTNLLVPGLVPVSELPIRTLRESAADNAWALLHPWFHACLALSSYRDGKFEEAISWSEKLTDPNQQSGALALVVRAMAEEGLGRHVEALKTLEQAETLIPAELRTLGSPRYEGQLPVKASVVDHDWRVAEILRREAHAKIHPSKK